MKQAILLLTNNFPYGKGEEYIENELSNLEEMENVAIINTFYNDELLTREVSHKFLVKKFERTNIFIDFVIFVKTVLSLTMNKEIWLEIKHIFNQKKYIFKRLKRLLYFVYNAESKYIRVKKNLLSEKGVMNSERILLYSYWFHTQAYIAIRLKKYFSKKDVKIITRAHGFDIYEDRYQMNYLPLRRYLLKNVDEVYSISDNGANFLKQKYKSFERKILVSKIGTKDFGTRELQYSDSKTLNIVSCSAVIPIKRIHFIIMALAMIKDIEINWFHFGDGPELSSLKSNASKNLSSNIKPHWMGHVPRSDIMKFYQQTIVDVFLNVSESEGIPVSIMEAMSFGIPTIATNVGGTSELVIDKKNGFLLEKDFSPQELLELIYKIRNSSNENIRNLRSNARKKWDSEFNASINFAKFFNEIMK